MVSSDRGLGPIYRRGAHVRVAQPRSRSILCGTGVQIVLPERELFANVCGMGQEVHTLSQLVTARSARLVYRFQHMS
jgi:hypothetical protein